MFLHLLTCVTSPSSCPIPFYFHVLLALGGFIEIRAQRSESLLPCLATDPISRRLKSTLTEFREKRVGREESLIQFFPEDKIRNSLYPIYCFLSQITIKNHSNFIWVK
jgi:hypothetical protein